MPRLKTKYNNEVKQQLQDKFQYENVMMIPKFEKIVVNMGVGEAATDSKAIDGAVRDLRAITSKKEAEELLPKVQGMLDKLAKRNIIHKNKAANLKSSLQKHVATLK